MNDAIRIDNLTKDFGNQRGVFDVSLSIKKGEVFGLVGINGSGKSTLMRHLMGFLKPQKGASSIIEKNCWSQADEIKKVCWIYPR